MRLRQYGVYRIIIHRGQAAVDGGGWKVRRSEIRFEPARPGSIHHDKLSGGTRAVISIACSTIKDNEERLTGGSRYLVPAVGLYLKTGLNRKSKFMAARII